MSNTLLTVNMITNEALMVLHQKLNFIGSMTRGYDDQYAKTGAKIGDTLRIRLPNEYVVRSGANLSTQVTAEQSVNLQVNNQRGVDLNFSSVDLTLSLDDFSDRIIKPAMSALAATMEADAFTMLNDIPYAVNNIGSVINIKQLLLARKSLQDNLAPHDERTLILSTQDNVDLVDGLKGLFQDSQKIAEQYREGMMGITAGYGKVYENTLIPQSTTGTALSATTYTVNGAVTTNGATTVTVAVGATTFKKGDVFTVANCFRVHPETKVATADLQQFVVAADYAGGAGVLSFAPAIYTSTGRQNVTSGGLPNGSALVKVGGASAVYKQSVAFQRGAFAFATADLVMPEGVDFSARKQMDGLSMRIVRQYAIATDTFPCRLDVLYGYATLRRQLAARIFSN